MLRKMFYKFLFYLIDAGIYLTLGGHWKTIRTYTKNKLPSIYT